MKEETLKRRVEKLEARHGRLNQKVDEHKAMYNFVIGNDKYSIANKIELLEREQSQIKHHLGLAGTAGECICRNTIFPHHNCPIHGAVAIYKKQKAIYDRLNNPPDLPLHVRVAMALGYAISKGGDGEYRLVRKYDCALAGFVPDYPNDLAAATGAFWEYLEFTESSGTFGYYRTFGEIMINGRSYWTGKQKDFAKGFCEAIVAHAEQQ
jgi:hypothetical protein